MSPPRAGTAVLQQTPETLSSYAFSNRKRKGLFTEAVMHAGKERCEKTRNSNNHGSVKQQKQQHVAARAVERRARETSARERQSPFPRFLRIVRRFDIERLSRAFFTREPLPSSTLNAPEVVATVNCRADIVSPLFRGKGEGQVAQSSRNDRRTIFS